VFAYGSNMFTDWLRVRCPSAVSLGVAELPGHELKWDKRSRDGSGKCNVVKTNDARAVVYGVLYEIPVGEKRALDQAEGLGNGYETKNTEVTFTGAPRMATIYFAIDIDPYLKPYTWYKAFVVGGAKEHNLPEEYIELLAEADAMEDPDRERHDKRWQQSAVGRSGRQS
jgi:gamma-glutamylcyclotransferase